MIINQAQFKVVKEKAEQLGFPEVGAAKASAVESSKIFREWVQNGFHAGMGWYEHSLEKRLDPQKVFPGVETVLILLSPYYSEPCKLGPYDLARYACGDDYHDVLKKRLKDLCRDLGETFPGSEYRVYVDSGPIAERYWAEKAGLGWIGKNGNLIHKRNGSYFFLSCILTNLEFPFNQPHTNHCGTCRVCIDRCPTQAIVGPGIVDSNKCISYLTIEHRGAFEMEPQLSGWVFGCDICQEVCPWNRKKPNLGVLDHFLPRSSYAQIGSDNLINFKDEEFRSFFSKSPIKRTKSVGLIRNIEHLETDIAPSKPQEGRQNEDL